MEKEFWIFYNEFFIQPDQNMMIPQMRNSYEFGNIVVIFQCIFNNVQSTNYKIEFGLGFTKMDTVTSLLVIYSKIKYTQFW